MRVVHDAITEHLGYRYKYQKKHYDWQVQPLEYQIGQGVWLRVYPKPIGQSQALHKFWDETWIITGRISQVH